MKSQEMPSRISGNAGIESTTMVDEFCKDLYDFLGESNAPKKPGKPPAKKSRDFKNLFFFYYE